MGGHSDVLFKKPPGHCPSGTPAGEEILPWYFCVCLPVGVSRPLRINRFKPNTQQPSPQFAPPHPGVPPLLIHPVLTEASDSGQTCLFSTPLPPSLPGHLRASSPFPKTHTANSFSAHSEGSFGTQINQVPPLPLTLPRFPLPA